MKIESGIALYFFFGCVLFFYESPQHLIDFYSSRALLGYRTYVELAERYESLVGWNFASYGEYNGVVEMPDGYLTAYVEKRDVTEQANALIGLDRFCKENGCEFLYIQAPSKVCKYDDKQTDFNADMWTDFKDRRLDDCPANRILFLPRS